MIGRPLGALESPWASLELPRDLAGSPRDFWGTGLGWLCVVDDELRRAAGFVAVSADEFSNHRGLVQWILVREYEGLLLFPWPHPGVHVEDLADRDRFGRGEFFPPGHKTVAEAVQLRGWDGLVHH